MLPSFCRDTITILRPTIRTVRGTQVADYSTPDRIEVEGCHVNFQASSIDRDGRLSVEVTAKLHAPALTSINADDHIEYDDAIYELLGEPLRHVSPTGSIDYIEATLARWSG